MKKVNKDKNSENHNDEKLKICFIINLIISIVGLIIAYAF